MNKFIEVSAGDFKYLISIDNIGFVSKDGSGKTKIHLKWSNDREYFLVNEDYKYIKGVLNE